MDIPVAASEELLEGKLKEYICFIKQIQQNTTIRLLKFTIRQSYKQPRQER